MYTNKKSDYEIALEELELKAYFPGSENDLFQFHPDYSFSRDSLSHYSLSLGSYGSASVVDWFTKEEMKLVIKIIFDTNDFTDEDAKTVRLNAASALAKTSTQKKNKSKKYDQPVLYKFTVLVSGIDYTGMFLESPSIVEDTYGSEVIMDIPNEQTNGQLHLTLSPDHFAVITKDQKTIEDMTKLFQGNLSIGYNPLDYI